MKIGQLRNLIHHTGLTPEELGQASGLSGMTVRRWLKQSPQKEIAKVYVPALREACYELAAKGRLQLDDEHVRSIVLEPSHFQSEAVAKHLGVTPGSLDLNGDSDRLLLCLNQIGMQEAKREEVEASREKLTSFKKMGTEWSRRITLLWKVVRSERINALDKLVAFGALFYLITPFDLIPDQIPLIGMLDDFIILGIATTYYASRYRGLTPEDPEK